MKAIACNYGYGVEKTDAAGTANTVKVDGTLDFESAHVSNDNDLKVIWFLNICSTCYEI